MYIKVMSLSAEYGLFLRVVEIGTIMHLNFSVLY